MKQSKKLEEILRKNREFEEKSPYNFCDRWCKRCIHEKQFHCALYKDELERKITCIAHGRNEDDVEITEAVMDAQYKEVEEKLSESMEKFGIDEDELDKEYAIDFEDLPEDIQKHIRFVENNPLDTAVKNYCDKARAFLNKTFYKNENTYPDLKYDFETMAWYHTLLPAKIHRALCGFHEPAAEDDFSLCDAVAQFNICLKSIKESVKSLKKISERLLMHKSQIQILIALLNNFESRIRMMLEGV